MLILQNKLISEEFKKIDEIIHTLSYEAKLGRLGQNRNQSFLLIGPDKITSKILISLNDKYSGDDFFYPIYIDGRKVKTYNDFFLPILEKAYTKIPQSINDLFRSGITRDNINKLYRNWLFDNEMKKRPLLIIRRIDQLFMTLDFPEIDREQYRKYKFSKMCMDKLLKILSNIPDYWGFFGNCLRHYFLIEPSGSIIGSSDDYYIDSIVTLRNQGYGFYGLCFRELFIENYE